MRLKIRDVILILVLNILFIFGLGYIDLVFRDLRVITSVGFLSVLILALILILFKFNFREFTKVEKGNFKDIFYAFLLFFPVSFLGRLIAPEFDNLFVDIYNLSEFGSYLLFMGFTILPLLKEEIIERVSQLKLRKAYGSKLTLIFLSMNFALIHYFGGLFLGSVIVVSVFLGSIILVSFYERTKNFLHTFLLHVIYDFVIVIQIFLHLNYVSFEWAFWGIYGILFLIFMRKSWSNFVEGFERIKVKGRLSVGDWTFLVIFGLLPVLFITF